MAEKSDDVREDLQMSDETTPVAEDADDALDNVIRVDFGAARGQADAEEASAAAPVAHYDASSMPDDPLASKKHDIFCKFIDLGMVSVTLNPEVDGVCVPPQFVDKSELILNFSHRFFIEDFTYDERAVCASLSFSGRPFYCVVPWGAVKMMLSHHDNSVAVFDSDMLY